MTICRTGQMRNGGSSASVAFRSHPKHSDSSLVLDSSPVYLNPHGSSNYCIILYRYYIMIHTQPPQNIHTIIQYLDRLRSEGVLAPLIEQKVRFLSNSLLDQQTEPDGFLNVDVQEFNRLRAMSPQEKIQALEDIYLRVTTAMTLEELPQTKVQMKADSLFAFWHQVLICSNLKIFTIRRKGKVEEMKLYKMNISKITIAKSRAAFMIDHKGMRHHIGMEDSQKLLGTYKILKSLIANARREKKQPLLASMASDRSGNDSRGSTQAKGAQKGPQESAVLYIEEECPSGFLETEDIDSEAEYRLLYSLENGRILQRKGNKNKLKVVYLIRCRSAEKALNGYMKTPEWNPEVQETKVDRRLSTNSYIIYQKYKYSGFTTRARDFVTLKMGVKKHNRFYLFQRSIEHASYPKTENAIRGEIHHKVTCFFQHPNSDGLVLMITDAQIEYGGYANNQKMLAKYYQWYEGFGRYLSQKQFEENDVAYFNFQDKRFLFSNNAKSQQKLEDRQKGKEERYQNQRSAGKRGESFALLQQFEKLALKNPTTKVQSALLGLLQQGVNQYFCIGRRLNIGVNPHKSSVYIKSNQRDPILCGEWILNQEKEFVFTNQKVVDAQKDVIKFIIKQIGIRILQGKSIMNMSLPVDIFDDRSILERSAASLGYAPIYLTQASKAKTDLDKIGLTFLFALSVNQLQFKLQKPFNPILGQTFQGYLAGIPIVIQQIYHHPPISSFYMKGPDYTIYGNFEAKADVGVNTVLALNPGVIHVIFPCGTHLECVFANVEISGITFGQRKYKIVSPTFVFNKDKGLFCEVSCGRDKKDVYPSKDKMKSSDVIGGIFKVTPDAFEKFQLQRKKDAKPSGLRPQDVTQKLLTISGNWSSRIFFNEQPVKEFYDPLPYNIEYEDHPLPSDSNFRFDILHKRMGNLAQSQKAKEVLEDIQRNDRKLRSKKR